MDTTEPGAWIPAFRKQYDAQHGPYDFRHIYEVDEELWVYADALQAESKRRKRTMKKLIIFDCDGTLIRTKSGETFRQGAEDWQWLPGRLERLAELREQGVTFALATNQGGVAFGYMEEPDITVEIQKVAFAIDASMWHICYDHPKATIERYRHDSKDRKPGPGMLLNIMETLKLLPQDTLMVGDREEDKLAAEAAGTSFEWAHTFFRV